MPPDFLFQQNNVTAVRDLGFFFHLPPGRPAILVDDGLASGFTMHVAVEAMHKKSLSQVVVAVPTGPIDTVRRIAADVDSIYCLNIRSGITFAVADAYKHWCDVTEQEALDVFGRL